MAELAVTDGMPPPDDLPRGECILRPASPWLHRRMARLMPLRYTRADEERLRRECDDSTAAADLTRDLYANLVGQLYDVPPARRARSCWVMNHEWYDECCKIGGGWPEPGITTMLGLPFVVAEDGGFPHLIAD